MGLPIAFLARVLGGGGSWWTLPSWPTPSGTVVQVTDDTEFTAALSTLAATGGIIELDPAGTYAARTFSSNPSAMIYIVSASSSNKATIASVTLNAEIGNITFKWIKFGGTNVSGGDLFSGRATTPYPDARLYGCDFLCLPIDPYQYPIFLNVASTASFAVGETITGGTSGTQGVVKKIISGTQLYVGITTTSFAGGSTQANPFLVTETITGSIAGSTTVAAASHLAQYSTYGLRQMFKNIYVQGCTFSSVANSIKCGSLGSGAIVKVLDNDFDLCYEDAIFFNRVAEASLVQVAFNRITRATGSGSDYLNPHCDSYQISPIDSNITNLHTYANVLVNGFSRGFMQGIPFHSDLITTYYTEKIVGNVGVYYGATGTQNFTIDRAKDCYMFGNLLARGTPGSGSGNLGRTFTAQSTGNVSAYNVYESGGGYQTDTGDYTLSNTDANYETVYAGLFPLTATTHTDALAEIQTKLQPKSGGPLDIVTSYVDWTNKKINQSIEPAIFKFTSQIDQITDATVTSEWRKNWTAGSRAISVTNGEYRIADDSAGTNATAWTSAAGTITEGKWVQVRTTAASTAATAKTVVLTVGSATSNFVTITATAQAYTAIDNGGVVYSATPFISSRTFTKMLIGLRFRADAYVGNGNILADSTAALRLWYPANGNLRFYVSGSSNSRIDINSVMTAPSAMQTHLIAIDLTKPTVNEGGVVYVVDGVKKSTATNTWFASTPTTVTFSNGFGLFDEQDGGGTAWDGAIELFWCDWGDASYQLPDITDPAVFAKFYKDLIGADGSGVTGSQPKLCYYGDLTEWNAGLANKGSLTATLTNTGGSYT